MGLMALKKILLPTAVALQFGLGQPSFSRRPANRAIKTMGIILF